MDLFKVAENSQRSAWKRGVTKLRLMACTSYLWTASRVYEAGIREDDTHLQGSQADLSLWQFVEASALCRSALYSGPHYGLPPLVPRWVVRPCELEVQRDCDV